MNDKGLNKLVYLVKSQQPWMPGKMVLTPIPVPAWQSSGASIANMAIMKMMATTASSGR